MMVCVPIRRAVTYREDCERGPNFAASAFARAQRKWHVHADKSSGLVS